MSLVPLPPQLVPFLSEYLPAPREDRPFVTLTYAQSLDSRIAARPGAQTKISHLETKTMTHYLRSQHDAILVGSGTVLADDPKLNCRYNEHLIRPVVVDPHSRWIYRNSTLRKLCELTNALAPFIVIAKNVEPSAEDAEVLQEQGGKYIRLDLTHNRQENWSPILKTLHSEGIQSVMVEGGAAIINDMLETDLVDSLIITIGPVFLGSDGVEVSPASGVELENVRWWTGQSDSVMAATLRT